VLGAIAEATATRPAHIVFKVPGTSYELHLEPSGGIGEIKSSCEVGKRIIGIIRAEAKRIDEVRTGGRYVEPVYGRPRRVQGRIVAIAGPAVVVDAGVPIHCTPTDPRQEASSFEVGQFVSFDVKPGASFERVG
jgi:hypothetical protein